MTMTITHHELRKAFSDAGYREHPVAHGQKEGAAIFFQKMLRPDDLPSGMQGCIDNDGKMFFNIYVWDFVIRGHEHRSVEVEITASYRDERTAHLKLYGIKWSSAIDDREQIERELLAGWAAMAASSAKHDRLKKLFE